MIDIEPVIGKIFQILNKYLVINALIKKHPIVRVPARNPLWESKGIDTGMHINIGILNL